MATRKIKRIGIEEETGRTVAQYEDGAIEYADMPQESITSQAPPEVSLPQPSPVFRPLGGMLTTPPPQSQSIHPGAMIGGTLGELASIPIAPLTGPLAPVIPPIGAGIGGGIGEFISQLGGNEPINLAEIKRQTLMQGGGSAAGRLIGAAIQKGYNIISGGATSEAERAISYLTSKGLKQPLLPAEATENRMLDLLDNVSSNSLIGGSAIQKFKVSRKLFMDNLSNDILTAFGRDADPQIMAQLFIDIVDGNLKLSRVAAKNMYNTVDDLLKPIHRRIMPQDILGYRTGLLPQQFDTETVIRAPINIKSIKSFAYNKLKVIKQTAGISSEAMGDDIVKEIADMPDIVDYKVAQDLKTRLMKKVDFFDVTDKTAPAKGIAKKGISMIDDAIEKELSQNHPEAYQMWREANDIWKSTGEQFNNRFIRTIIRKVDPDFGGDPEKVVSLIFKSNMASRIQRVKYALNINSNSEGRALWNKLRGWAINDSFKRATNKEGELIGSALEETLFGRTGLGDKVIREVFTSDEIANIKEFSNALKVIQARTQEGTGRIFIQLSQAGAVIGTMTGRFRKAAIAILGGPYIFSRIFTSPKWSQALINGLKLSNNPKLFIQAMTRLSTEIGGNIFSPSQQILPQDINYQQTRPNINNLPSPIGIE